MVCRTEWLYFRFQSQGSVKVLKWIHIKHKIVDNISQQYNQTILTLSQLRSFVSISVKQLIATPLRPICPPRPILCTVCSSPCWWGGRSLTITILPQIQIDLTDCQALTHRFEFVAEISSLFLIGKSQLQKTTA